MPIQMPQFQIPEVQKEDDGGFLGAIGSALKAVAPLASLIPGVGPLAGVALGAAAGMAGSVMQGGGAGGAIQGAIMGGAGAGALRARTPTESRFDSAQPQSGAQPQPALEEQSYNYSPFLGVGVQPRTGWGWEGRGF